MGNECAQTCFGMRRRSGVSPIPGGEIEEERKEMVQRFNTEPWIKKKITSAYVPKVIRLPDASFVKYDRCQSVGRSRGGDSVRLAL